MPPLIKQPKEIDWQMVEEALEKVLKEREKV